LAGEVSSEPGNAQSESVEAVVRSLPAGPAASNAQLRLAQAAFQRQDWAKASQLAQAALAARPDAATAENAMYLSASAQLRAGKAAEAAAAFRRQLAAAPKGKLVGEARLGLTWSLLDAKKWAEAETAARSAVAALAPVPGKPASADTIALHNQARLALGESLLRSGKARDAAPVFTALSGSSDKEIATQAAYGAALSSESLKQWDAAATGWGKYAGLVADPATRARAYYQQGQALVNAKNGAGALAAFDKAVAADPKGEVGAQALYESAWAAHDLKQGAQETTRWQRLATEFPDSKLAAEANLQQGEALFAAKSWAAAAQAYSIVTQRYGQSDAAPQAWYKLGSAQYNLKAWTEAAAAFDKAAAFPKSPVALESSYWAGESLVQANNVAAARPHFEAFIKGATARPNLSADLKAMVPAARLGIGRALAAANDWAGAVAAYQAASNGAQGAVAAETGFYLGEALVQQGKLKEGATQFLKVATLYGGSEWAPRAQWGAAEATEKSGDKEAALQLYRALAERQPASPLTTQAQEKVKALGGA
jgi:TolA-binding protein